MAFPTTGVLDSFDAGALENLNAPRAGWGSSVLFTGDATCRTSGTPTNAAPITSVFSSNFWNTSFGPDCEVYAPFLSAVGVDQVSLFGRVTATGSVTAYELRSTNTSWQFSSIAAGAYTSIGVAFTQAISAGDSMGMEIIGSTLTAYYKASAGSWTSLATRTDSTITAAGFIGLQGKNTIHQFDSFGGGALASASVVSPYRPMIIQQGR